MSVAEQIVAIEKAKVLQFLRVAKSSLVHVHGGGGFLSLQLETNGQGNRLVALIVADYDGPERSVKFRTAELRKAIKRGKANAMFEIGFDGDGHVVIESEGLLPYTIRNGTTSYKSSPFNWIGDYQGTLQRCELEGAADIIRVCDKSQTRYSLGAVLFDDGKAVATDGRRMAVMDVGSSQDEPVMVDSAVVEFANKFGFDADILGHKGDENSDHFVIAGELICEHAGRFPAWRKVIPQNEDEPVMIDAKWLSDAATVRLDEASQTDNDQGGFDLQVGESKVMVNASFLKEMAAKMRVKQIAVSTTYTKASDKRASCPLVFRSPQRPEWMEIVMPMSRD